MKVGYLTKRKDACWYIRTLTPASELSNSFGYETRENYLELHMSCALCKTGGVQEFTFSDECKDNKWLCNQCGKELPQDTDKWKTDIEDMVSWADLLVLQRVTSKGHLDLIRYIKSKGKPVIVESDDDYINVPTHNPGYNYYKPRQSIIEDCLREADGLSVTTPWLKELYSAYNKNVQLIPNAHDNEMAELMPPAQRLNVFNGQAKPIDWDRFVQEKQGKKLFAWWGSPTHEKDLELVVKPLKKLMERDKDIIVGFMGYVHRAFMHNLPTDRLYLFGLVPVTMYFQAIKALDQYALFAPVENNLFNKGKSGLKVQEAMAMNIIPVASNFDTYKFPIGYGWLAENNDYSWWTALRSAASISESERQELISLNRDFLYKYFDVKVTAPLWDKFFKTVKAEENIYDDLLKRSFYEI